MSTSSNFTSYALTYPYWLYAALNSIDRATQFTLDDTFIRIYRPFRSGKDSHLPTRPVQPSEVPFLPGRYPTSSDFSTVDHFDLLLNTSFTNVVEKRFGPLVSPTNSLRIDVQSSSDHAHDERNVSAFADRLVQLLRWRSGQWWIGRSMEGLMTTATFWFPVSEQGKPIIKKRSSREIDIGGLSMRIGNTFNGRETAIDGSMWNAVVGDLGNGTQVPICSLLLLDSWYFCSLADFRRAVLDAATSCEQAKNDAFRRVEHSSGRKAKLSGYDLEKHIDEPLHNLCGRSYRAEHPAKWRTIELLWDARGNVGHGGKAEYRRRQPAPVEVNFTTAPSLIEAAEHCVSWLQTL